MKTAIKTKILAFLLLVFYSALRLTWRIHIEEPESLKKALRDQGPCVFAHWHGDELGLVFLLPRYRAAPIVSTSKDGEIMATVVRLLGSRTARGSSTRGGASAIKAILRLAREGWRPSLAVDGPKGPLHKAKPGVFEISKLLNAPIFPLAATADRTFVFKKSWNQSFLPLPFAKLVVVWGEPLLAVSRESDGRDPRLALALEEALTNAGQRARDLIAEG
jgi:lysophospholipid acyltransferase (LPLAT)-like uncharacterized protein